MLQHNFELDIQIDVTIPEHIFDHHWIINTIKLDFDKIGGQFTKISFSKENISSSNTVVIGLDMVELERVIGKF